MWWNDDYRFSWMIIFCTKTICIQASRTMLFYPRPSPTLLVGQGRRTRWKHSWAIEVKGVIFTKYAATGSLTLMTEYKMEAFCIAMGIYCICVAIWKAMGSYPCHFCRSENILRAWAVRVKVCVCLNVCTCVCMLFFSSGQTFLWSEYLFMWDNI